MVLVALDWAALHDILKGEPDTWGEWGTIVFSVVLFAGMIGLGLRGRGRGQGAPSRG